MSSSPEFIEYVCEQIRGTGVVTYRKMFGEYCVYLNLKPIFLVCDDMVFVKMLAELVDEMEGAEIGHPYEGAKEHYILDIDDREQSQRVAFILEKLVPVPKKKKGKKKEV